MQRDRQSCLAVVFLLKKARQIRKLLEKTSFLERMGDNIGDPFDDIDSEDEDLEKPPTPDIHHGGDSPDTPGFSDISDNEREEMTNEGGQIKHSEDSNDSEGVNSPAAEGRNTEEDIIMEDKQQGSPVYDQEISPVSSTAEHVEEEEIASGKTEEVSSMDDKESTSVAAKISEETTPESIEGEQENPESNVEGKDESSRHEKSAEIAETSEDIPGEETAGNSSDPGVTKGRRRRISSDVVTDDDLEMPISPLGLGLSGTESDLVEDILKSGVSGLLPDIKEDSKEEVTGSIHHDIISM